MYSFSAKNSLDLADIFWQIFLSCWGENFNGKSVRRWVRSERISGEVTARRPVIEGEKNIENLIPGLIETLKMPNTDWMYHPVFMSNCCISCIRRLALQNKVFVGLNIDSGCELSGLY